MLDVYQQRMEILETVQHPVRFYGLWPGFLLGIYHCQQGPVCKMWIYISGRKVPMTSIRILSRLTLCYKWILSLSFDPPEAMKYVAFCNHSGKDQIS